MAMEITNNYSSVYESTYAAQKQQETKKEAASKAETKGTVVTQKNAGAAADSSEYFRQLAKLAPSVEFRIGNTFSTAKSGKTLTINPALLKKMQNDPEQKKETMELIKGVEFMTKFMDGIYKASGKTVVFRHSYIDENGKYRAYSCVKSDDRMSKKLREERRKNFEKFMAKTKEKAAKRKEELQKSLEEKRAEKREEKTNRAEKLINEKIAASEDGMIYMDDTEFREILDAMKEDSVDVNKANTKEQPAVGVNLDLQV